MGYTPLTCHINIGGILNKLSIDSYLSELNSSIFFAHNQYTSLIRLTLQAQVKLQ